MGGLFSKRKILNCPQESWNTEKVRGVNYGNRFIPEHWMGGSFFEGLTPQGERPCLADVVDVNGVTGKVRMFKWLDLQIREEHFEEMRRLGVKVVRVPCGYWNWISYTGLSTPNAPESDADGFPVVAQLRNLQQIAEPEEYVPFFDRIFDYSRNNGISVLLDLHGLPGSQNGEMHSGILTARKEQGRYYFETEWNCQRAVEAIGRMARYGASKPNFFGVQVINEPQRYISHKFLAKYYQLAIDEARKHIAIDVPIILFAWSYDFERWVDHPFRAASCGNIMWDTHIYRFSHGPMQEVKGDYWKELDKIRSFAALGNQIVVGEWTVAGIDCLPDLEIQKFASWFVRHAESEAVGTIFWNFDGPGRWGFQNTKDCIEWSDIFSDQRAHFRKDFAPCGLLTYHGTWLSASKTGNVSVRTERRQWEEWTPHVYLSQGVERIAFQSWHGKWLCADSDGNLHANADTRSAWEEFTPFTYLTAGARKVALQSSHGKWLRVDDRGSVSVRSQDHSAWEEITVVY